MRLSAAIVAAGLVCVVSAQEQRPPSQQPPIFRAGVDVVQVEVSILDADRRPVHGLTAEDIEVREDGKLQEIIDVQEIVINAEPKPPVWARAVGTDVATNDLDDRRLIGIVMDDLSCCSLPGSSATDRWAVQHAIDVAHRIIDSLGPRDLATVALTHELMSVLPFTGDRDALKDVVKRFSPITDGGCWPAPPAPNVTGDLVRLFAMSPQPTKTVIKLYGRVSGESRRIILPCAQRSYVVPDTGRRVYPVTTPTPSTLPDILGLPPVPVYNLNISGLDANRVDILGNGPNPSGGRNYILTNDLRPAVDEVLDENSAYYLIGFRTSRPTTDGKYRRLDFKVKNHGDYWIRTREGYLRPAPPAKPGSRADRNPELPRPPSTVARLLPSSDITLNAAAAVFALPGFREAAIVTTVDLTHEITESTRPGLEELTLRTVAYVAGDSKYDVSAKTAVDVPPGTNRVSTSFPSRLNVAPERYELWLTARDSRTNRVGGVFYNIEVPDVSARAVSVSGVVIGRTPTERLPLPASLAGLVPIVPTTVRMFGQGEAITAYFQIYQGRETPLGPVALTIQVLDDRGGAQLSVNETFAPEQFGSNRTAEYRLRLPLDRLTSGRYLLSIEAKLGDRIAPKRDVPFAVR
jgi:hypothetical protein